MIREEVRIVNYLKKLEKSLEENTAEIRKNMNEMRTYWRICFLCGFIIFEISLIINLNPITSDEGIQYLLSAISQALAAVFTLVFTVSLMVATMAGKYTAIDKFFNRNTISFMALFATGIILPILLLNIDSNSINSNSIDSYGFFVSLSTGLAAFCIVAVIPYLKSLNNILKFDIGVSNLISELHESIATEQYTKADTAVYNLLDIGKSAIENKREEPTEIIGIQISKHVEKALSRPDLGQKCRCMLVSFREKSPKKRRTISKSKIILSQPPSRPESIMLHSFSPQVSIHALSVMGKKAIDAQMDQVVAKSSLYGLKDAGILLISKGFDSLAEDVIFNIHEIGISAIKHKLIFTSIGSLNSLLCIMYEKPPTKCRENCPEKAYDYFGISVANFEKHYPEEADRACDEIKRKKIDINQILPKERRDRINKKPELAGFVDKFINRFNSN